MKQAIFGSILIIVLIGLLPVRSGNSIAYSDLGHAHRNAKTVYFALREYEEMYGHYPTEEVPEDLIPDYPQKKRSDSNFILGQLTASCALDSERYFTIRRSSLHDDIIDPPDKILEAGECQFSYISKVGGIPYSTGYGSSACPILMFPMIPDSQKFDPNFYKNQQNSGFYLALDGSYKSVKIDEDRFGLLKGQGKTTIFTTGDDTIWEEDTPLVHHPLPYDGEPSVNSTRSKDERSPALPIEKYYAFIIGTFLISLTIISCILQRRRNKSPSQPALQS